MLFSTSLVALILSPRHLIIQNTKVPELLLSKGIALLTNVLESICHLRTYLPLGRASCPIEPKALGGRS
jgi:hypothetical protein